MFVCLLILLSTTVICCPSLVSAEPRDFTPYHKIQGILAEIAATSNRVKVEVIGQSVGGNDLYLVTIASPQVLNKLNYYKWFVQFTVNYPEKARWLVEKGVVDYKATIYIHGSIHGNEMAGTDACLDLIRLLAYDNSDEVQEILKNAIIIINVCANPDGRIANIRQNNNNFDLNRDFITASQPETRLTIQKVFLEWTPLVTLDLHGYMGPDWVLIEPCTPPHNPNTEFDVLIKHLYPMALEMEAALKTINISTVIPYRDWPAEWDDYPPIFTPMYGFYHASYGITFETANWRSPGTIETSIKCHYLGSLAAIKYTVKHKYEMFWGQTEIFLRGLRRGNGRFPYAYIIPVDPKLQVDPLEAVDLVNHLIFHGVKVHEATHPFKIGKTVYPKGTYVVLMNQPRSGLANTILWDGENLSPPPDYGLDLPMYDISGWNFPELWGVTVIPVDQKFHACLKPVKQADYPKSEIVGFGDCYFALKDDTNNAVKMVNRLLAEGIKVYWTIESFNWCGATFRTGTFIIPVKDFWTRRMVYKIAKELHLTLYKVGNVKVGMKPLQEPKVAIVFDSGVSRASYGAANFVLKNLGFKVDTINYAAIRRGALQNYDIVIIPDGTNTTIANRLGSVGHQKLKEFVEAGGVYLGYGEGGGSLASITSLINVKAIRSGNYGGYNNGVVRINYNPNDPVTAYYPLNGYAFVFFPVWFEAGQGAEVLAKYAEKDLLVAGWWPYYDVTASGQPAIVKGSYGNGTIILMGIEPTFRAHPEVTFRLVANSIFLAASN
ncbi:MAG: M14 family zinc carboxypeptidase [Candidatus Bathyarchaeota archaeon]|nr:M14 family zinc carboxypeptidase [Candidatus Bathyarchaeota archaeon]MDW8041036.1 M14 family zinc carboxypeptidase [Nitrososphaerota archaeon]